MPATRTRDSSSATQAGFTLLELMLTITVAALIAGLAVPNMRQFLLNNRMTGAANDLLIAVHLARTEAIKRHAQTVMCFSASPDNLLPSCNGDGSQGWIVFVDDIDPAVNQSTDNNGEVDAGEPILLRHNALPGGITVKTLPAGNKSYLAYSPSGFRRQITAIGSDLESVRLCDARGNIALFGAANSAARGLVISATGRPSITRVVSEITTLGGCP